VVKIGNLNDSHALIYTGNSLTYLMDLLSGMAYKLHRHVLSNDDRVYFLTIQYVKDRYYDSRRKSKSKRPRKSRRAGTLV